MPIDTNPGLLDWLRLVPLLEPAQLRETTDRLQVQFPEPKALARELVRLGWLTPFQVNQLFRDRGRDLVVGPYVLLDRLGHGGMGEVFKARHTNLGRLAALKLIRPGYLSNLDAVQRFHREARAAAQLNHPNIVTIYEAGEVGDTPFLAMEFVEGTDLSRLVKEHGSLPVGRACAYVRQAALGLQHAHEHGLVHRDIKPSNLIVTRLGGDEVLVKVLDFGLARLTREKPEEGQITGSGQVMGTPDFIAPEQAQSSKNADIRADIFSLGCTLFYLLSGKVPFQGENIMQRLVARMLPAPSIRQFRPDVHPALVAVLARMLAVQPAERHQTPAEVAADLLPFVRSDPAVADSIPTCAEADGIPVALPVAIPVVPSLSAGPAPSLAQSQDTASHRRIPPLAWMGAIAGGLFLLCATAGLAWWIGSGAGRAPVGNGTTQPGDGGVLAKPVVQGEPKPTVPVPPDERHDWQPPGLIAILGTHHGRHWGPVYTVARTADGSLIASGGSREVRLWDGHTMCELSVTKVEADRVTMLALSPDGKLLAAAGAGGGGDSFPRFPKLGFPGVRDMPSVYVWDVKPGGTLSPHARPKAAPGFFDGYMNLVGLTFSADGKSLLMQQSSTSPSMLRWAVDGSAPAQAVEVAKEEGVVVTALAPGGGPTMAWVTAKGEVKARHLREEQSAPFKVREIAQQQAPRAQLVLSEDGSTLACAVGPEVEVWDISAGKPERRSKVGLEERAAVAMSRDGRRLAVADRQRVLHVWDVSTADPPPPLKLEGHGGAVTGLSFGPDGHTLLSCAADHSVRVWELAGPNAGKERFASPYQHGAAVAVAFPPDGKTLASVVRIPGPAWPTLTDRPLPALPNFEDFTAPRTLDPARVRLWDAASWKETGSFGDGLRASVLGFDASGGRLLVGGMKTPTEERRGSGDLILWDITGEREEGDCHVPEGEVTSLAVRGNRWAVAGGSTGWTSLHVGTVEPFKAVGSHSSLGAGLAQPRWTWHCVALSPDGKLLAVGGSEKPDRQVGGQETTGVVELYDPDTISQQRNPERKGTLKPHGQTVTCLAFSPDGKTLLTGANDGTVLRWDVSTAKAKALPGEKLEGGVNAVAFAPDGRSLAAAGADGRVRVWDAAGAVLASWRLPGPVHAVAFDETGERLALGNGNGTVYIVTVPRP